MCISDLLGLFNCLRTYPESAREQITTPRNGPLREETPQTQLRMVLRQKSPVNPIFLKNPETLWDGQKIVAAHCRLFQSLGMSRLSKPGVLYPPCVFYSPFEGSMSEIGIFRQLIADANPPLAADTLANRVPLATCSVWACFRHSPIDRPPSPC